MRRPVLYAKKHAAGVSPKRIAWKAPLAEPKSPLRAAKARGHTRAALSAALRGSLARAPLAIRLGTWPRHALAEIKGAVAMAACLLKSKGAVAWRQPLSS